MSNSIGEFEFLALDGPPMLPRQEVVVMSRPGVTGVAVWLTGQRGQKFTLRSSVDTDAMATGYALAIQYQELIGADAVELFWNDNTFQVLVLDVRAVEIKSILGGVGGLNPPSEGFLVCDWDLVAVI